MAKVEFSKPKKQLPEKWQDYQWAIDELEKHFEKVVWQIYDCNSQLGVGVGDIGAKRDGKRKAFYLKGVYHGPNAKLHKLDYTDDAEESPSTYDDPDWQVYDLLKQDDPHTFLDEIIKTIKSKFNLKTKGVF